MSTQTVVIVGASLTGASAAAELRKRGFDGRIVLIGDETELPYERPELSKKYLRREIDEPKWVRDAEFYRTADIELVLGARADAITPAERKVVASGETYRYDRLLLATGAAPRRLDVPGATLDGIVTLRTRADADTLRERALAAASVVVVGGGWIGAEVAASLRQLGRPVTLVVAGGAPLEHVLGPEVADVYRAAHEANGVQLVTGTKVARFDGGSRVETVITDDGRRIAADLVVVGVGAEPRTELASAAGLAVDSGVLVDERLETSVPGIYAAGDVANAWHPRYGRRLRVEHWDNAKRQGRAVAAGLEGSPGVYDRTPYFYSDQYDIGMEYTGFAQSWDEVVFRGDPASREFIAFWLTGGRVVAGMNVNVWDVAAAIDQLIRSGQPVDRDRLRDPAQPLEELASAVTNEPGPVGVSGP